MRGLTLLLGAALLAAVAAIVIVSPRDSPSGSSAAASPSARSATPASPTPSTSVFSDPCGTFDTTSPTPYAVTGYWLVPTSDHCTWRSQLQAIHRVGGDTVVRLGFGLQPRSVDQEGRVLSAQGDKPDPRYEKCQENGLTCVQAAESALKAANPGNRITWTYVYRTDEAFGPDLFRCPQMEHTITVGGEVFYRMIAPDDGSDNPTCDFTSKGLGYHLILVDGAVKDSLTEILDLADRFAMKVFPALPLAPRLREDPTRADPRHIGTLTTLTRRVLQDYGDRFKDRAALGGVYQPFELQIRDWPDPSAVTTLQVYAEQHEIVQQELPDKPIMVSPYLDARRARKFTSTPAQVKAGFMELARTGVGIVAPQDSRGTGKVGLFWPNLSGQPVDKRLQPIVGDTTYRDAYYGATRDYYRAMAEALAELRTEDVDVQLWANVEAFEPSGDGACEAGGKRGVTDKKRLDSAVTFVGPYVSKIISYKWSSFFTCGTPTLAEQVAGDWDRPIPIQAVTASRGIQEGLEVRGYNLTGGEVTLSWFGGKEPRVVDSAAAGWADPEPIPGLPGAVRKIWVPVDWSSIPGDAWVRVDVTSADGRRGNAPVYLHRSS
ncbi:hypothetical protein Sme01_32820 [Sphaerisporangium melleum]|uniref:DUF4434 domain-containing protein n=1 Tax=Sphaerisporangium melleum TaxID=321316 RepID=A0A917QWJ3_9ACTN|nr:DUF4434 domain-containing protein [Sphaerisporangium melleum]GGK73560.1 hypothetical protein GCM10007964_15470 [Sphaerisporangium melleum]GII70806.1 hypothetical protein Sme01_32820 [Sphaerisporangium melleum]